MFCIPEIQKIKHVPYTHDREYGPKCTKRAGPTGAMGPLRRHVLHNFLNPACIIGKLEKPERLTFVCSRPSLIGSRKTFGNL